MLPAEPKPKFQLPTEIWSQIASHVSDPSDLLHLALSCRYINSIVQENHLQVCSVSTLIENVKIWHELCTNRAKAERVRRLWVKTSDHAPEEKVCTLTSEAQLRVVDVPGHPTSCGMKHDDDTYGGPWATRMATALSYMTSLEEFHLCVSECYLSALEVHNLVGNISSTVHDFELHVAGCSHSKLPTRFLEKPSGQWLIKPDYRRFAFISAINFHIQDDLVDGFLPSIISDCAHLEHLEIDMYGVAAGAQSLPLDSLWSGRWPQLKSLSIHGIYLYEDLIPAMVQFFQYHSKLVELQVAETESPLSFSTCELGDVLPLLSVLETNAIDLIMVEKLFQPLTCGQYRPIKSWTIKMEIFSIDDEFPTRMDSICWLASKAGTVTTFTYWIIEMAQEENMERHAFWLKYIARCIPTITELTLPEVVAEDHDALINILSRFTHLTSLQTVDFDGLSRPDIWNMHGLLRRLRDHLHKHGTNLFPSLRQIDTCYLRDDGVWWDTFARREVVWEDGTSST